MSRARRGQVLPLACVSLLFMAVMMLISFNLTNVVHEKIRLQNYSDAQAFSMATVEARAFNYLAYSNRASAAAFVTIASLHGFYAIANMAPQLLRGAAVAMGVEALAELAVCIATWGSSCCNHIHSPIMQAVEFANDASDADDTLSDWEDPFNDAVEALWDAVGNIHREQDMVLMSAMNRVRTGFNESSGLKTTARNASDLAPSLGALNAQAISCTTEGSQWDSCDAVKSEDERAEIYTGIINASRPTFSHHIGQMGLDYLPIIGDAWSDLTYGIPAFYGGDHAIADDSCSPEQGDKGELACGDVPFAGFIGSREDLPGVGGWAGSEIVSDEGGGDHSPSGAHDPDHDKFKGIPKCVQDKECFINRRFKKGEVETWSTDVLALYRQDLSERTKKDMSRPWLLGDDGKLSIEAGAPSQNQNGVLDLKPNREGGAVSRAVVYFHCPGKWPRPPNYFDPFWNSKLHPFDKQSMQNAITRSGNMVEDATATQAVAEGKAD
ncbi:MAG: hypothetical protein JNK82_17160 [Myxococcaceae bacterium]|nr:hypothetical protein [Myxococcaceae bacterium]